MSGTDIVVGLGARAYRVQVGAGLIDSRVARGFSIPSPRDDDALRDDEDALENDVSIVDEGPLPED